MTERGEDLNRRLAERGLVDVGRRVSERLAAWRRADFARRLWRKDPALWSGGDAVSGSSDADIAARLGWLDLPQSMVEIATACAALAASVRGEDCRHAVLLGMGGSSLAPDVLQKTFGPAPGWLPLTVLDTTHPSAVLRTERSIDPARTLFIVSSKSGTTIETLSGFHYFWKRVAGATQAPGRRFVAVTDPGTPLETLARERGFRHLISAPPDVGGRYSALTPFGLVPAALLGLDVHALLASAARMARACGPDVDPGESPGLRLGAVIGELARAGRDKLTFLAGSRIEAFPSWVEQLVAESTGKAGRGIVPVAGEAPHSPAGYGSDRAYAYLSGARGDRGIAGVADALAGVGHPVIRIDWGSMNEIGAQFFVWEVAIAAAGAVLGIDPFNQPDVEMAKKLAREAMAGGGADGGSVPSVSADDPAALRGALAAWLADARTGDYVALQAYLAPGDATDAALAGIRRALGERLGLATTSGYGPRFLHSTGQLHKGGPNTGLFLQIVDDPADDVAVPETDYTFRDLIHAQAIGDFRALERAGRRVVRVELGGDVAGGLARLAIASAEAADGLDTGRAL